MIEREIKFTLRVFKNAAELAPQNAALLSKAKSALDNAYAPYSNFRVAAAILLDNDEIVTGTDQENASYPNGVCAEGVALAAVSSIYPGVAIKKIAITVKSGTHIVEHPIAPCGLCRQQILEYETRFATDIEIILMGEKGEIYSVKSVKDILPLNFSKADL